MSTKPGGMYSLNIVWACKSAQIIPTSVNIYRSNKFTWKCWTIEILNEAEPDLTTFSKHSSNGLNNVSRRNNVGPTCCDCFNGGLCMAKLVLNRAIEYSRDVVGSWKIRRWSNAWWAPGPVTDGSRLGWGYYWSNMKHFSR